MSSTPPSDPRSSKTLDVEKHYEIRLPGWAVPTWLLRRLGAKPTNERTLEGFPEELTVRRQFTFGAGRASFFARYRGTRRKP